MVIDSAFGPGAPSDGASIAAWYAQRIAPWRRAEPKPAVVTLDHIPKRKEDRPPGPIGSVHKRSQADVTLDVSGSPWSPERGGSMFLTVAKDRHGRIGPKNSTAAVVVGSWAGEGKARAFTYHLEAPDPSKAKAKGARGAKAEDISVALLAGLAAHPEGLTGIRAVQVLVKANNSHVRDTLEELVQGDLVNREDAGKLGFRYTVTEAGAAVVEAQNETQS